MLLETFRSQPVEPAERIYILLSSLFVGVLLLTNVVTSKYILLGPIKVTAGAATYPLTFLLMDVIAECYGKKRARTVIWLGLLASIIMTIVTYIAQYAPGYKDSPLSEETFRRVFSFTPGIVLGSMIAYMVGQWVDVWLLDWGNRLTAGKYLWARNVFSTLVGQSLDTSIFGIVAWLVWPRIGIQPNLLIISWDTWEQITYYEYGLKVLFTIFSAPMVYGGVFLVKKAEKSFK